MQLQYAQMVLLNFPAILISGKLNFSWPHISWRPCARRWMRRPAHACTR